jgi:hypothetical protein
MIDQATSLIRVIRQTKANGNELTPVIIWIGLDPEMLSTKYPPSEIFGADALSRKEFDNGDVIVTHWFEQQAPDGSWQKCYDPRIRLNPERTDIEREIDAENRRRFPGDYM